MPLFKTLLTALGWSLLDSIWQMSLLWIVYYLLTVKNKRFSAAGKYNLALVFIFISVEWFVYSLVQSVLYPDTSIAAGYISIPVSASGYLPAVSVTYLFIVLVRFLQQGISYFQSGVERKIKSPSPVMQAFADRHAHILGITKQVRVYFSDLAETAQTSGFLRPVILIPLSLVTRLTPGQLEAIIVHELFHIRRNDYLINIFVCIYRSVFFFNPFARLFHQEITRERELACDDGVMALNYSPEQYAEALYNLEKIRAVRTEFAIAADGHTPWLLMERIQRVLGNPVQPKYKINPVVIVYILSAFILSGLRQKEKIAENVMGVSGHIVLPGKEMVVQKMVNRIPKAENRIVRKNKIRAVIQAPALVAEIDPVIATEPETIPTINETSTDLPTQAFFADQAIARNYSNEQNAGNNDPVVLAPGAPYVPAASFEYEDLPGNFIHQDTIRDYAIHNGIVKEMDDYRKEITVQLNTLKVDLKLSQKELKKMETTVQKQVQIQKRNIRPLLDRLRIDLKQKQEQIRQLENELRVANEEIIHI